MTVQKQFSNLLLIRKLLLLCREVDEDYSVLNRACQCQQLGDWPLHPLPHGLCNCCLCICAVSWPSGKPYMLCCLYYCCVLQPCYLFHDDQRDDLGMQDDDVGHDMIPAPSVAVPM